MWMKPTADVKCCRGDCIHYGKPPDTMPCRGCTCNLHSENLCKAFRYESKTTEGVNHDAKTPV